MVSTEIKFNEAITALQKAGRYTKFQEQSKGCTSIESKLNCAEEVLKESHVVRKNNGAETFSESFSDGYVRETDRNPFAETDRLICEGMGLSDEATRRVLGQPPADVPADKLAEYEFLRAIRISESDAKKLLTQGYKF